MKKQYFSVLFLSLFAAELLAQRSYSFVATTGTYAELNQAKRISFALLDSQSGFYRLDELKGETFTWYRTNFKIDTIKTFHIQPYANVRFDNDTALIIVDAGFTYLDSIDNTSSVSYTIEGSSGDKVIKTQWKNLKIRVGQSSNFVNMQIWVYQKTGIVEIHYGPSSSNNQTGFNKTSGPQVGMFFSRDNFTKCYEKLWVTGAPDALKLDSVNNYTFNAMSGVPVNGTVFRFLPRFATAGIVDSKPSHGALRAYPNPLIGDQLFLEKTGNYALFNTAGAIVLEARDTDRLHLQGLKAGVYLLRSGDGKSLKLVKSAE
jgi:hypothetical protein